MSMTKSERIDVAVKKTIRIMKEVGIKYGRSDFIDKEKWASDITITYTLNGNVNILIKRRCG